MSMRFRDSVVWVTGASSGIGAALGPQFHAEGAHVVLSARREDVLQETAARCTGRGEIMICPLDVTDQAAIDAAAAAVLGRFGCIDILVNNAGITHRGRVSQTDISVIRRVMEVDYFGAVMLTKAVLPSMLERGSGRIACISSVAGKYGSPMRSGYCGAKHAMHGFFDSLREEVRDSGIGVTIAVPGAIRTDVSINALTGDGSRYGRMDPFLENGMPPEVCAAKILDAIDAGTPEALIAEGVARRNVVLKRWAPWLLSRTMRRKPGRGNTVPGRAPR
jgi:short-subunit dehydrogenase